MSAGIREAIELATPQRQRQAQQHTTPPRCPAPLPIFLLLLLLLLFLLLLLLLHLWPHSVVRAFGTHWGLDLPDSLDGTSNQSGKSLLYQGCSPVI